MEQRKHARVQVDMAVSFSEQNKAGEGFALNLSQEGCLVESDAKIEPGAYVELSLRLTGLESPVKVESAAVRWVQGRVFGIEFLYMQTDEYERLRAFLDSQRAPAGPDT